MALQNFSSFIIILSEKTGSSLVRTKCLLNRQGLTVYKRMKEIDHKVDTFLTHICSANPYEGEYLDTRNNIIYEIIPLWKSQNKVGIIFLRKSLNS
ncbi:MAG: hypothetical protein MRJ93_03105 [Nitrososphaeraceae archaeon]|nr:hypothetical protein [Nitrososphaeraceae archaeon]